MGSHAVPRPSLPPLTILTLLVASAVCVSQAGSGAVDDPVCAAGGHRFMAGAWADTCECTDPEMVPQSNGSSCLAEPVCTRLKQPCSKQCALHPSCNLSVAAYSQCVTFDNVFAMERMIPPNIPQNADGSWFGFGDWANETVPYFINATAHQPLGRRTLLLHDLDQNIGGDPADRVTLPTEFAHCDTETQRGVWASGQCIVPPCPPTSPSLGPSFRSIFWDSAVAKRRAQSMKFFPQYKAAGGQLDELVMDTEEETAFFGEEVPVPPGNPAEMNASTWAAMIGCVAAKWSAIQHDPRFERDVVPALLKAGFPVPAVPANRTGEWLSELLTPFSDPNQVADFNNQTNGSAQIRTIWNAVMTSRRSLYWMQAFGESAVLAFPKLRFSDFTLVGWSPQYCVPQADQLGWLPCRAGTGSSPAFNTHAMDFYNQIASWRCYSQGKDYNTGQHCVSWGEGIDGVLHDFGHHVPYDTFNRTGFNAMKLHLNSARAATLAFPPPATVLRPWLAFKSFSPRLPGFLPDSGPTHYWQEEVIHAAITGADFFLYFNSWSGYLYGTRAMASDHKLLSDVLHELTAVIGCDSREWVADADIWISAHPASFYLSGVRVAQSSATAIVWRFTLELPVGHPGDDESHAALVLKEVVVSQGEDIVAGPVAHGGQQCSLRFPRASLVEVADPSVAPYGVWISQPGRASGTGVLLNCSGRVEAWPVDGHQ